MSHTPPRTLQDISAAWKDRWPNVFSGKWLVVWLLLFLLPGVLQHAPWKTQDAEHFGIVWRMLESGVWVAPSFSQSVAPEPPGYYWLAALSGHLLQGLTGLPGAIRLASTLFAGLTLWALYAARKNVGSPTPDATLAPLLLIGAVGFLIGSHDVQPKLAIMCGYALTLLAATEPCRDTPNPFRYLGILALGVTLVLFSGSARYVLPLLFLLLFLAMQQRRFAPATLIATAGGALLWLTWWLHLQKYSVDAGAGFLAAQMAQLRLQPELAKHLEYLVADLGWFAWPLWPLAIWAFWAYRIRVRQARAVDWRPLWPPLVLAGGLLFTFVLGTAPNNAALMPMLTPLALLATPGAQTLRRGSLSGFDWFGRMTFGLLLLAIWLGWAGITLGWPAQLAAKSARMAPGFEASFSLPAVMLAIIGSLFWMIGIARLQRSPQRSVYSWTGGMTLVWLLASLLWMPWVDYQRAYTGVAASLNSALKESPATACILAAEAGEAQFSAIAAGLERRLLRQGASCSWRLIQMSDDTPTAVPGWTLVTSAQRPGDRSERYRLYRRAP